MLLLTRFDVFYLLLGLLSLTPLVLPFSLHLHDTALEEALQDLNVQFAFVGYYWKFEESPTTLPTIAGEGVGGLGWGFAGNFFRSGKNI